MFGDEDERWFEVFGAYEVDTNILILVIPWSNYTEHRGREYFGRWARRTANSKHGLVGACGYRRGVSSFSLTRARPSPFFLLWAQRVDLTQLLMLCCMHLLVLLNLFICILVTTVLILAFFTSTPLSTACACITELWSCLNEVHEKINLLL